MLKRLVFPFLLLSAPVFAQNSATLDSLDHLLSTASSDTARMSVYEQLAKTPGTDFQKSLVWADTAIRIGNTVPELNYRAIAAKTKGDLFIRHSENDSALVYYTKTKNLYAQDNNKEGLANAYYLIGNVQSNLDNYSGALQSYIQSEKYAETCNSPRYIAYARNGIGTVSFMMKNYREAKQYHLQALDVALKTGDNRLLGWTYTCLGNCAVQDNNYHEALDFFRKELGAYSKTDFLNGVAGAYNNIGVSCCYLNQFDEAIVNYKQAAAIKEKTGDPGGEAIAYQNIAQLYSMENKNDTAEVFARHAVTCAGHTGSVLAQSDAFMVLSDVYASEKKFDSAYHYHVLFKKFNDSVYNQSTQKELAEMQAKYDNDKQQQQIAILQKDKKIGTLWTYALALSGGLVLILALFTYNRSRIKTRANRLLAQQNAKISEQKKAITDSIAYARRIQQALLPTEKYIDRNLKRLKK